MSDAAAELVEAERRRHEERVAAQVAAAVEQNDRRLAAQGKAFGLSPELALRLARFARNALGRSARATASNSRRRSRRTDGGADAA